MPSTCQEEMQRLAKSFHIVTGINHGCFSPFISFDLYFMFSLDISIALSKQSIASSYLFNLIKVMPLVFNTAGIQTLSRK
jgi:hypothetical protein